MAFLLTQRKLDNHMRSERGGLNGIGFNDSWNVENFGLTKTESICIAKALSAEYGLCTPAKPNLQRVRARLERLANEN